VARAVSPAVNSVRATGSRLVEALEDIGDAGLLGELGTLGEPGMLGETGTTECRGRPAR